MTPFYSDRPRSSVTIRGRSDRDWSRWNTGRRVAHARVFVAQRRLSYAQLSEVRRIAAALLERELSAEGPMAILSAMTSSTRFSGLAPCTPAFPYSLMSSDFGKLREILAHKGVAGRTQSGQKPAFSGRNLDAGAATDEISCEIR